MTDHSQLVKQARAMSSSRRSTLTDRIVLSDCADALKALTAERDALRARVAELEAECPTCGDTGYFYGDQDLGRQGHFCGCKIGVAVENDRALLERMSS